MNKPHKLDPGQTARYHRDGYLFPLEVFSNDEIEHILESLERARTEAENTSLPQSLHHYLRVNSHITMPFVSEAARNPKLLDKVESIIGPNLMLLAAKRDYAMQMRGADETGHWVHVAPPPTNFDRDCVALHARINEDQAEALARGAEKELRLYSAF